MGVVKCMDRYVVADPVEGREGRVRYPVKVPAGQAGLVWQEGSLEEALTLGYSYAKRSDATKRAESLADPLTVQPSDLDEAAAEASLERFLEDTLEPDPADVEQARSDVLAKVYGSSPPDRKRDQVKGYSQAYGSDGPGKVKAHPAAGVQALLEGMQAAGLEAKPHGSRYQRVYDRAEREPAVVAVGESPYAGKGGSGPKRWPNGRKRRH